MFMMSKWFACHVTVSKTWTELPPKNELCIAAAHECVSPGPNYTFKRVKWKRDCIRVRIAALKIKTLVCHLSRKQSTRQTEMEFIRSRNITPSHMFIIQIEMLDLHL